MASDKPEASYLSIFKSLPGSFILLRNDAPTYTVLAATPEYLTQTGTTKEGILGKGIFEAFPGNPDDPNDTGLIKLKGSLEQVVLQKQPHFLPRQRYDMVAENGSYSEDIGA